MHENMAGRRDSTLSRVSQRDDVMHLPYFHSNFASTDEVAHYIKKKAKGQTGHFLLRPSNRNRNLLTASVLVPDNSVRHTHIQIEDDGTSCKFFLVVEKKFNAIQALVDFYSLNPVKNLEGVNNVYFVHPLCRSDFNQNNYYTPKGTPESQRGKRSMPNRSTSMSSLGSNRSMEGGSGFSSIHGQDPPPPLPVRPRTQSTSDTSGTGSAGTSGFSDSQGSHMIDRPALPLPTRRAGEENPYYSRARDVTEDISQKLKDVLKSTERCECGIPRSLAELPMGWTVHLSKDALTAGRLFYQGEDGTTSWSLPEHVRMQLTNAHIQNLKQIDSNWTLRHPRRNTSVNSLNQNGVNHL